MPCTYCGVLFRIGPKEVRKTWDHVWPRSRYVQTVLRPGVSSLVPACFSCNRDKADMTVAEWLLVLRVTNDPRAERVQQFEATLGKPPVCFRPKTKINATEES